MSDNNQFGYIPNEEETEKYIESLGNAWGDDVAGLVATDDGRDTFLYKPLVYLLKKCAPSVQSRWLIQDGNYTRLRSYNQGSIGSCQPAGTPILMNDGSEKPIEEIKKGDIVISHTGAKRKVINTFTRKYTGDIYTIHTKGNIYPISMTADHKMAHAINTNKKKLGKFDDFIYDKAEDLVVGDRLILSYGLQDEVEHIIDITKYIDEYLINNDGKILPKNREYKTPHCQPCNRFIKIDTNFARLIGLYLAEGGTRSMKNIPRSTCFSFGSHEPFYVKEVIELIKHIFGIKGYIFRPKSCLTSMEAIFSSSILSKFLHNFVTGNVYNKKIPNEFYSCSKLIKLSLIKGWIDGDGHTKIVRSGNSEINKKIKIEGYSVSSNLIRGIYRLCLSCDLKVGVYRRLKREHQRVDSYYIGLSGENALQIKNDISKQLKQCICLSTKQCGRMKYGFANPITKISKIYVQNLDVYDFEVEEDHSFISNLLCSSNCVGNAEAMTLAIELAVDIIERKVPFSMSVMFSPEVCYGLGREVGNMLGRGDGCYGSAVAKASTTMGAVFQQSYGKYDLSNYSVSICRQFGYYGVPDELKKIAIETKLQQSYLIKSVEEAWALIGAGNSINQCSNIGYSSATRDSDGAIKRGGSWGHSMNICGRRTTKSGRKLFLIMNSWGDSWASGILIDDQPPGSFYADYENVASAIAQRDCFVKVSMSGIRRKKIDWSDW